MVLAVIVAVTLWWGFVREHAPLGPPGIRVEADFTNTPDGPAPHRFDGGQPATIVASPDDAGDRLRVERGRLTDHDDARQRRRILQFPRSRLVGEGYRRAVRLPAWIGTLG